MTTLESDQSQSAVRTRLHSRSQHWANRLPSWVGSIRFRLTAVWSSLVFGLAAIVIFAIYIGLRIYLENQRFPVNVVRSGDTYFFTADVQQAMRIAQNQSNARVVQTLGQYSLVALLALFVLSLIIGWIVSGRMLRPIGEISETVRHFQASDLSQRINLGGPDDELRRLADTFDDMLERLDKAFEGQRQFIHEASHELRNPLAVIRTNLEVTLSDPNATAEDLRQTAEVVQRSTERMARLVDDLLIYARKGTLSLERAPVDASLLIEEAADEFRVTAESDGIELLTAADNDLWLFADRLALRQALGNLLANALRLSSPGTTVRLRAGREGPWIWMAVEDQGPGIDANDQDLVFQRFWRGAGTGGPEPRSGLGLAIVRQIAEAHGGEVKLVSEVGRGSAFALWIPALSV